MIVVDTSALVAIIKKEPLASLCIKHLVMAEETVIAAPSVVELHLVMLKQLGKGGVEEADALIEIAEIRIAPWTPDLLSHSLHAARHYRGGPARLNFGDCLSYALAKSLNSPLLYVGEDFAQTDIRSALA